MRRLPSDTPLFAHSFLKKSLPHATLDCQPYQARRMAAVFVSARGCRSCQAWHAAACESWRSAAGPVKRSARLLPPYRITQPPPSAYLLQASPGCYLRRTPHANEPPFSQAAMRCCDVLKTYIANACFKCCRCFRGMLQAFQMDVTK
jgi:hypothetical protein